MNMVRHRSKRQSVSLGKITRSKSELRLEKFLQKNEIPFDYSYKVYTQGGVFTVDFLVDKQIIVECEGWVHSKMVQRDNIREELLKAEGYTIMRFANFEIFKNIDKCLKKIKAKLST